MADSDEILESYFDAGRRDGLPASDELLRRIEADALAELDRRAAPVPPTAPGGLRGILAALGGWRAGAGLASAAMAGLVLGVSMPATLTGFDDLALFSGSYQLADFAPGYGLEILEGE